MENKANPWLVVLAIAVIVAVAGGGLYYWNTQRQIPEQVVTEQEQPNETTESVDQEWLTYTSDKGFSISYPNDWSLSENAGNNSDLSVVSFNPPLDEELKGKPILPGDRLSIYYYDNVADEPEASNLGATTLDELVSKNSMITKIGSVEIGGLNGTDVIWGGFGAYYTILVAKDSHLYKIQFSNENELSETEQTIISSFEFTN
ncbi:hypothetical protein KKC94_01560 [Patescibacteria group bacterium]|nr:hypothetical protein [Patescibacteria group bacterium]